MKMKNNSTILQILKQLITVYCLLFAWQGCTIIEKVKTGYQAYDAKQYAKAITLWEKDLKSLKSSPKKGEIAFLMSKSYAKIGKYKPALDYVQIAIDNEYGVEAYLQKAELLKMSEKYGEALQTYEQLEDQIQDKDRFAKEKNALKINYDWRKKYNPKQFTIEKLKSNTDADEYLPFEIGRDSILFTSDKSNNNDGQTYAWTGRNYSDTYLLNLSNSDVSPYLDLFNSKENDGALVFSRDKNWVFYSSCRTIDPAQPTNCQLYFSRRIDGVWTEPSLMPFVQDGFQYVHPAISTSGDYLIFASNQEGTLGGMDLFISRFKDEVWSDAIDLGSSINSEFDEVFPSLVQDTLYFASNHFSGMGGFDLYKTYWRNQQSWAPIINLKPPFNSGADDTGYLPLSLTPTDTSVYSNSIILVSNRGGSDDLYLVKEKKHPQSNVPTTPKIQRIVLNLTSLHKIYMISADPNSPIRGRAPLANVSFEILENGKSIKKSRTDDIGFASLELKPNTSYEIICNKKDYFTSKITFSTEDTSQTIEDEDTRIIDKRILLEKKFKNQEIALENIYYNYDKWELREDAYPSLQNLAQLLRNNPTLQIQLSAHTDCRGEDDYNLDLSQKRAKSVVDYLISQGIDPQRLVAVGYGETSPNIPCVCENCTEEQHQKNRRTTFKVLKE